MDFLYLAKMFKRIWVIPSFPFIFNVRVVPVFGAYDFSVSKTYEIHSSPSIRLFIALVCNISFHITFYRAKVTEMAVFGF